MIVVLNVILTFLVLFPLIVSSYQKSVVVAPLNDKNFKKFLKEHQFVLVMFGTSLCKKCEKLFEDFEFAANEAAKNNPVIFFGEIDCYKDGMKTCDRESITDFPTLKIFKFGRYSEVFLYRKKENIATFAMRYVNPEVEELNTTAQYKNFLNTTTYGVVGFFERQTPLQKTYFKLTNILFNRFDFAITKSKLLLTHQRISNGVIVYKPWYMRNEFERDYNVYKNEANVEKLKKFVLRNFHGLVGFRTVENEREFKYPILIVFYDFDFSKNQEKSKTVRGEILKTAKKYKSSKLNFAISNWFEWSHLLRRFDVKIENNTEPIVTIFKDRNRRYLMKNDFNEENLNGFVQNYFNNTLVSYVKSKDVVENNQSVIEVAYKDFKEKIMKSEQDIFLEIYDPKCKVTRKLKKHVEKLAEDLRGEITVAMLDGVDNDIPNVVKTNEFPTFYFLRKGEKVRIYKFYGARNFQNFIKFIAKNCNKELKRYHRDGIKKAIKDEL